MCSYIFVSMAYGIMMEDAGFKWYYSLLVSLTVYTGAFQFVLITFLSSGASIITVALTALLMNSRQSFYSLTFLEDFKKMGKRMLYKIHTMTDETYAVNCTLELPQKEKEDTMFLVAFFSRCYWLIGSVLGGMLGQLIPWDMEGIDFCMTALFVINILSVLIYTSSFLFCNTTNNPDVSKSAGLAGPIGKNTSLSDHGSADRLLFERCGK